jgi:hypothetical protein
MIPPSCPLQSKLIHTVSTPWLRFSSVTVMNRQVAFAGARFDFDNPCSDAIACVGGGLIDATSPSGAAASFLASFFQEAFAQHDVAGKRRRYRIENESQEVLASLRDVMFQHRQFQNDASSIFSDTEFSQYSLTADAHLLRKSVDVESGADWRSEAVWFVAERGTAGNSNEVKVMVSNVGACRGFGVPLNLESLAKFKRSVLSPQRLPVVPLTMDHHPSRNLEFRRILDAGGRVENDILVTGGSKLAVSRGFGFRPFKSNASLPQVKQQIIAEPTTSSWRMLPGDMLVLANRGAFLTRSFEELTYEDVGHTVVRSSNRKRSPAQIACDIADEAVVYGSPAGVQVLVVEAVDPGPGAPQSSLHSAVRETTMLPGRMHVAALQSSEDYRQALLADCARCGVKLTDLIDMRSRMLEDLDCSVLLGSSLTDCFGLEAGTLRRAVEEEMQWMEPLFAARDAGPQAVAQQLEAMARFE